MIIDINQKINIFKINIKLIKVKLQNTDNNNKKYN